MDGVKSALTLALWPCTFCSDPSAMMKTDAGTCVSLSVSLLVKLSVQWQPHKLPDLVEKLHKVVDAQYVEADRALLGYGDFVLRPEYISHISGSDPRRKRQHPHLSASDRHLSLLS